VTESPGEMPAKKPSRIRPPRAEIFRERERHRVRWWIPVAAGGAVALALALILYLRSLPDRWETFRSEEGGFSADFPAAPEEKHLPAAGPDGLVSHEFFYGTAWEDEFYRIGYVDVPAERAAIPQALFDGISAGWLDQVEKAARDPRLGSVKVLATDPYAFGGFPGRQMKIDIGNGLGTLTGRWILVESRLYALSTGVRSHHHGENDARFLASFRLLPKR